jgi:hypothetical protein
MGNNRMDDYQKSNNNKLNYLNKLEKELEIFYKAKAQVYIPTPYN